MACRLAKGAGAAEARWLYDSDARRLSRKPEGKAMISVLWHKEIQSRSKCSSDAEAWPSYDLEPCLGRERRSG